MLEHDFSEGLWCKLTNLGKDNESIFVGVYYKSPSLSKENEELFFQSLKYNHFDRVVLIGDFNYPDIDWVNMQAEKQNSRTFLNIMQDNFLVQHVDHPTRGNAILDLLFTSDEAMVRNLDIGESFGGSDHNILRCDLVVTDKIEQMDMNTYSYMWNKGRYRDMKDMLSKIDWDNAYKDKSIDEMWNVFNENLQKCVDLYIPKRKAIVKQKPKWMTKYIMKMVKKKRKLWKRYKDYQLIDDWYAFIDLQRVVKNEIRKAKHDLEHNIANKIKQDPKCFYSYIRSKQKIRDGVTS